MSVKWSVIVLVAVVVPAVVVPVVSVIPVIPVVPVVPVVVVPAVGGTVVVGVVVRDLPVLLQDRAGGGVDVEVVLDIAFAELDLPVGGRLVAVELDLDELGAGHLLLSDPDGLVPRDPGLLLAGRGSRGVLSVPGVGFTGAGVVALPLGAGVGVVVPAEATAPPPAMTARSPVAAMVSFVVFRMSPSLPGTPLAPRCANPKRRVRSAEPVRRTLSPAAGESGPSPSRAGRP